MVVNASFWQGKRVLLTGHTGFKGAWLSLWLSELGARVTGYALEPPTSPSLFGELRVDERVDSRIGDITDLASLKAVFADARPEVVIHMAAQSLVLQSYDDPIETYMTNVIGTANVFEAIRSVDSVRAIVNVTTDKCYENREWHWGYREDEPMGGHDPYSSSKACSELITRTYAACFFGNDSTARLASARAGNVIGGGDWSDNRLIPDFVRAITAGDVLNIRNPGSIRPWQHVLEPLSGYLMLAEKLCTEEGDRFLGGWNFGPHDMDARPVSWIADHLCAMWGNGSRWEYVGPNDAAPHEATYLKLDCSKARAELGWQPRLNLETALEWIIDWNRCHFEGGDTVAKTIEQINAYAAKSA